MEFFSVDAAAHKSFLKRKSKGPRSSSLHPRRVASSTRRFRLSPPAGLIGSPQRAITTFFLFLGIALRLWQYLANSSLWIDEAALARNIIERRPQDLLGSLDYAQLAPVGFVLLQKAVTSLFGSSEYVLRAFPLICGVASLFLFQAAARRILSGWALPFAIGLFSVGIPFIYFSSQVKQYSSDIAVALLLLVLALDLRSDGVSRRRATWLGIAGLLLGWISQTALFVMVGIGTALLIQVWGRRDRQAIQALTIIGALWLVTGVSVVAHSVGSVAPTDREYFKWFWNGGFMPLPPRTLADVAWLPMKLIWVFGAFAPGLGHTNGGLNYRWSPVFAAMMLIGYWTLWRKQRDAALFLLLPVLAAVGASAVAIYPFTARLLAFLIPFFLLVTAAGAHQFLLSLPRQLQFLNPVALAVLVGAPIYAIATALPPSWVQHFRPVMAYVDQRRERDDRIYVYSGAGLAFGYYAPRFGFSRDGVVLGRCAVSDPRNYFRELDRLRGERRVWILFTHEQRVGELNLILGYLDATGQRLDALTIPASNGREIENAHAYLYDLSERVRPGSISAETYQLPTDYRLSSDAGGRWRCYGITGGEPARQR